VATGTSPSSAGESTLGRLQGWSVVGDGTMTACGCGGLQQTP